MQVVERSREQSKRRTFEIIGASQGSIGAEAAKALAAPGQPTRLYLVGRDESKVAPVVSRRREEKGRALTAISAISSNRSVVPDSSLDIYTPFDYISTSSSAPVFQRTSMKGHCGWTKALQRRQQLL